MYLNHFKNVQEELRKYAVVKTNELRRILLDDQNKKSFTISLIIFGYL